MPTTGAPTATERRESGSTCDNRDGSPNLFTNALHVAIENNSYDVCVLLLTSGISPNEPGVQPFTMENWRRSSHTSDESGAPRPTNDLLTISTINKVSLMLSQSREPLIRTPSIRSMNSTRHLSPLPLAGASLQANPNASKDSTSIYVVNSNPSSINSDLSSVGRYSTPIKVLRLRADMWPNLKVVHTMADGTGITYDEQYTRDYLYCLPPIFLCVALNNCAILRQMVKHGADVNVVDR